MSRSDNQSWFSPAMWIPGTKLGSETWWQVPLPLGHLAGPGLATFTKPMGDKYCENPTKLLSFHQASCVCFFSLLEPARHFISTVAISSVHLYNKQFNECVG